MDELREKIARWLRPYCLKEIEGEGEDCITLTLSIWELCSQLLTLIEEAGYNKIESQTPTTMNSNGGILETDNVNLAEDNNIYDPELDFYYYNDRTKG